MIYLMNSAVLPMRGFGSYSYEESDLETLTEVLRGYYGMWESRIRYTQNVGYIAQWTGVHIPVDGADADLRPDDKGFIIRLKHRFSDRRYGKAQRGETPEEWEFGWLKRND